MPYNFVLEGKVEEDDVEEELRYLALIENKEKTRSILEFHRQGANKRPDHAMRRKVYQKGWKSFKKWKDHRYHYDDVTLKIQRKIFRAVERQITGS